MKCVHPRKAYNLMKAFLNAASDLVYTCGGEEPDKIEIIPRKSDCFSAENVDTVDNSETLEIYYNFDGLFDESMKLFRDYWTQKVPMLAEFADITLTLLHELGHLETTDKIRAEFPNEMRELFWFAIDSNGGDNDEKNRRYFEMPDERAATEWGIEWLKDAEHQRFAKNFEKNFYSCFKAY